MANININDNRENPIQTLVGIFLAVSVGTILFGLIPGFLIASIIDQITPIKTGSIWAFALISTITLLYVLVRKSKSNVKKALINYVIISAVVALIIGVGALLTEGDVFYGYTAKKMFYFLENSTANGTYQEVELERGREKTQYLSWKQIKEIESSDGDRVRLMESLGFKFIDSDTTSDNRITYHFLRFIDNHEFCSIEINGSYIDYFTNNINIHRYLIKNVVEDGFLLDSRSIDGEAKTYRKGSYVVHTSYHEIEYDHPYRFIYYRKTLSN
jgi:hypothetical protein